MTIRGYTVSARTIAALVAIIAVVLFLLWAPAAWRSGKTAKKQAEVSQGQAGASIDAGAEAANTMGNIIALGSETDDAVATGQGEVRAAPEADRGRATVAAACRLRAYRDTPQCKEPSQ